MHHSNSYEDWPNRDSLEWGYNGESDYDYEE